MNGLEKIPLTTTLRVYDDRETRFMNSSSTNEEGVSGFLLNELLKFDSRHARRKDYISSIIHFLLYIYENGDGTTFLESVERFGHFFGRLPPFLQCCVLEELRLSGHFVLLAVFCSTCSSIGVSVPQRLLFSASFPRDIPVRVPFSYAMGFGKNSYYNLGVPSESDVRSARLISLPEVVKVSMADMHTLFLTKEGEVYGCGYSSHCRMGNVKDAVIVSPSPIKIPTKKTPIVDVLACHEHSIFISCRSVYVCGVNTSNRLGPGNDIVNLTRYRLTEEGMDNLIGIWAGSTFTAVFSTRSVWFVGCLEGFHFANFKMFSCEALDENRRFFTVLRSARVRDSLFSPPTGIHDASPVLFDANPMLLRGMQEFVVNLESSLDSINVGSEPSKNRSTQLIRCELDPAGSVVASIGSSKVHHDVSMLLHGLLTRLFVKQFHISDAGFVTLLAIPRTGTSVSSLYRGKAVLVEEKSFSEGFELPSRDRRIPSKDVCIVFKLEEVQGTSGASQFSCSPCGNSVIYVVAPQQMLFLPRGDDEHCKMLPWNTTHVEQLNAIREETGMPSLEPTVDVVSRAEITANASPTASLTEIHPVLREAVELWMPKVAQSWGEKTENEKLEVNLSRILSSATTSNASLERCILRYLDGYHRIHEEHDVPLDESVLMELGLELFKCLHSWGIRPISTAECSTGCLALDCTLVCSDGIEIPYNIRWLCLQSSYFELALSYASGSATPRFNLDFPYDVVISAIKMISHPFELLDLSFKEIISLIMFFDQYAMCAAIEDCLSILFERATEFNVVELFDLYLCMEHLQPALLNYFSSNLHLVTMWSSSSRCPLQLLKKLDDMEVFDSSESENISIVPCNNILCAGAYFSSCIGEEVFDADRDSCSWSRFVLSDVETLLLGEYAHCDWASQLIQRQYKLSNSNWVDSFTTFPYSRPYSAQATPLLKELSEGSPSAVSSDVVHKTRKPRRNRGVSERENSITVQLHDVSLEERSEMTPDLPAVQQKDKADVKETIVDNSLSSPAKSPSAWGQLANNQPTDDLRQTDHPARSKRVKFTPKGTKFRPCNLEDDQKGGSAAPWSRPSTSCSPQSVSLLQIQAEELLSMKNSTRTSMCSQEKRRSRSTWSESASDVGIPNTPAALVDIIAEEQKQVNRGVSEYRPLEFVNAEEKAIDQIGQLYRENAGDEVLICVQRVHQFTDTPAWGAFHRC